MSEKTRGLEPETEPGACICLADLEPIEVEWLWPGRIPFGKVAIIEGRPETGKSTLTLEIAARVTSGRMLPGGVPLDPINVLLIGIEDGVQDTVLPRFIAAEGDRARVFIPPGQVPLSFPSEVSTLRRYVDHNQVRLIVIDPISAFLDDATNTHNDHDVRRALAPLAQTAEETGTAIVIVRHLNKGKAADGLSAGGGSIGFTALARTQILVDFDPHDPLKQRRILAVSKNNLMVKPRGLTFAIGGEPGGTSRLSWAGETELTADDLVAAQQTAEERIEGNAANEWLRALLETGPHSRREVLQLGRSQGFSDRTIERASNRIGVNRQSDGYGSNKTATWSLPDRTGPISANSAIADTPPVSDTTPVAETPGGIGNNGGIDGPGTRRNAEHAARRPGLDLQITLPTVAVADDPWERFEWM